MSSTRSFLFAALAFVTFMLWQAWQHDYAAKPASAPPLSATAAPASPPTPASNAEVPHATAAAPATAVPVPASAAPQPSVAQRIQVHTDLLRLTIDTRG